MGWVDSADTWVVEQVQGVRAPALDELFRWLSGVPLRVGIVLVAVALATYATRTVRPAFSAAAAVGLALLVNFLATTALKYAIDRARPPDADPDIDPLVPVPGSPSFPSGHASSAFAVAAALATLLPSPPWRAVLFLLAAAVAFSRIWLGVHYATDIVVGALLGTVVGWLMARVVLAYVPERLPDPPPPDRPP